MLLLSLCASTGRAQTRAVTIAPVVTTTADWREDIDAVVRDIRVLHPDPFTKTGRVRFLREVEDLKAAIPRLTEEQRVARAMQLVALIGDGHTQLLPTSRLFSSWYPFRLYQFSEGVFVTSAHRSAGDLAGAQLLEIAGQPAVRALTDARHLFATDNESGSLERLYAVHNAALMEGLGYASPGGSLRLKFRLRDGTIVDRTVQPTRVTDSTFSGGPPFEWRFRSEMYGMPFGTDSDWVSAYGGLPASAFMTADTTRPLHLIDQRGYMTRALRAGGAYYIRMNYVDDTDLIPFIRKALNEVDSLKPERLILDLRRNFGGDGSVLDEMIHEFIKRESARPWKAMYVLTGPRTFSAAVMLVNEFIKHVPVSLVGEAPASALNHFGDPTTRDYPRTGLRLQVSTLWHQLSSSTDLSEYIGVDAPAPFSFSDYAAGRDPAVDAILRGDEMRSITAIALGEGGRRARSVYRERSAKFGNLGWYAAPRETDLRFACRTLTAAKRTADGLETCILNTEVHPWVWNTWFNLALAQSGPALLKDRVANARCAVAVAPNEHNAEDLKRYIAQKDPKSEVPLPAGCPVR
jgi:hypothetical protein